MEKLRSQDLRVTNKTKYIQIPLSVYFVFFLLLLLNRTLFFNTDLIIINM